MSEKWQVAVYLVHNTNTITREVYDILEDSDNNYTEKQQKLLKKLLKVESSTHKYRSQKLVNSNLDDFELYLFYRKHPKASPSWKSFLLSQVQEEQEIRVEPRNMNESFVLFLFNKSTSKLYAITGGYGAFTIKNYIDDNFGIDILIRIVENKGDRVLKSAREFGVTGGIIGVSKYFRKKYNFHENDNFGNIYKEVAAHIDKDTARKLGITVEETKQCIAKNSFKLNYSVTFDEMVNIVSRLNEIIDENENFSVNDLKQLDVQKDEVIIENLQKLIENEIWDKKENLSSLEEYLDFVHKDYDKFLLASNYRCCRREYDSIITLYSDILQDITSNTKQLFKQNLYGKNIVSYDEEGKDLTSDKIFNHLVYELKHNEKSYFLINGKYFQIIDSFLERLNDDCKVFINDYYIDGLEKTWGGEQEGVYNLSYKGEDRTVVLDTITPQSIEPCDILKYDEQNVYLYHVKKGFNGSMRDLAYQVRLAADRISADIKSDKNYLKSVYDDMQGKSLYRDQVSSKEEFLSIFNRKKLCFILAVKDDAVRNRNLKENIEEFNSNIAKFALVELVKDMRDLGVDFKITQIFKPD